MRIRSHLALAAFAALASTGCVSQEKYNAMRIANEGLKSQLATAQQTAAVSEQKAASWKLQLDQLMAGSGSAAGLTDNLYKQNANLQAQLADITAKYNDALSRIGQGAPLPKELTSELTSFADQNPDLVEFDPQKGTVKFKSDLTFASGDATLQTGASNAITKFASILNSNAAKGYELMVCGYADNQKVSAPTMQKGHKDNWYLSSHRALSVAEALQKQGVAPTRIGAVGYGEFRPIADNSTKAGMAMNRRVEVLILPTQMADARPGAPAAPMAAPVNEKPAVEATNKDDGLSK